MCKTNKGFTLIETILAAGMVLVIALASYSAFSQGVKLWQRLTQRTPASKLNIVFEKMSSDLRNSFVFSGINFVGAKDSISFAALTLTAIGERQKVLSIGEIGYFFDAQTKSLNRRQRNYSQLYQDKTPSSRQMVNDVKSLRFQYYYYDPEQEIYIWKDNWQVGEEERSIPLAVRIRLEFDEKTKEEEVTGTITIFAGG